MAGQINFQPAIHHGSMVTTSLRGKGSPGELQGAQPIPVHSVLASAHDASPSSSASGSAPDLRHAQVRDAQPVSAGTSAFFDEKEKTLAKSGGQAAKSKLRLLPLLQHDLKKMDGDEPRRLLQLLQHDLAWTINHWDDLKEMDKYQLQDLLPLVQDHKEWISDRWDDIKEMDEQLAELLPLLQHHKAWTSDRWDDVKEMDDFQMAQLPPLLEHDPGWTANHWNDLKTLDGYQLRHLLSLQKHDKPWTTRHLHDLKEMKADQLAHLRPLLQHDPEWTTGHWNDLKDLSGDQMQHMLPALQHDKAWTTSHLHDLKEMHTGQLKELSQLFSLRLMNDATDRFHSAANPYVREALSTKKKKDLEALAIKDQDMEEPDKVLRTHGASRSTFNPETAIASYLTERFRNNFQKIPAATFGVENEMFIPGSESYSEANGLNKKLGTENYAYVGDATLDANVLFANLPIEQVTSRLDSPEAVQRLQSSLSILNDWGAFTNDTAGVHIHMGIKQWTAADCLSTPEEKCNNAFLPQWDQDLSEKFPEARGITPYQLLVMKQFLVNMVAMQKDFYQVSRESIYSLPNGPKSGNDLDKYYQDISGARTYEELLLSANVHMRFFNINLQAYQKHGTIEVRGFTKKNSNNMEVDPNLPVRDLIFMQEVMIKVLHDTKNILLSGASPEEQMKIRPSEGLTEILDDYVQDAFLLEIVHALGQRNPERRVQTMDAIMKDKDRIASETLQKIRESHASLLEDSRLAQHFLASLAGNEQWNPSSIEKKPLRRINSLRSMADAALSGHALKP